MEEHTKIGWSDFLRRIETIRDAKDEEVRLETTKLRKKIRSQLKAEMSIHESQYIQKITQLKLRIEELYKIIQLKDSEILDLTRLLLSQELLLTSARIKNSTIESPITALLPHVPDTTTLQLKSQLSIDLLKDLCETYQKEAESAKTETLLLQKEIERAKFDSSLAKQRLELTEKVWEQKLITAQTEFYSELTNLRSELEATEAQLSTTTSQLSKTTSQLTDLKLQLTTKTTDFDSLHTQFSALKEEFSLYKLQSQAECTSRELIQTRQNEFIHTLKEELTQAKSTLAETKSYIQELAEPQPNRSYSARRQRRVIPVSDRPKSSIKLVRVPLNQRPEPLNKTCRASLMPYSGVFKLKASWC